MIIVAAVTRFEVCGSGVAIFLNFGAKGQTVIQRIENGKQLSLFLSNLSSYQGP